MILGIDFHAIYLKIGFFFGTIIFIWLSYRFVKWIISTILGATKASKVEKMEPEKYVIDWYDKEVLEREIKRCVAEVEAKKEEKESKKKKK